MLLARQCCKTFNLYNTLILIGDSILDQETSKVR